MRYLFDGGEVILNPDGTPADGHPFTVWNQPTGGDDITFDMRAPDGVTVVDVQADSDGEVPYLRGPDGNKGPVFRDTGTDVRSPWYSSEAIALALSIDPAEVAAATATATAAANSAASLASGVVRSVNGTTPDTAGNVNLSTGGSGAVSSVAGRTGDVVIGQGDVTNLVPALAAKADLVGGVVPSAQLPAINVVDFLGVVANQTAMLALTGGAGDYCIRSDTGTMWVITGATPSSLSSWTNVGAVTGAVSSVNGQTGDVTLAAADVGAALASHNHDAAAITSGVLATARLGTGTANSTRFLRGDGTWAAAPNVADVLGWTSVTAYGAVGNGTTSGAGTDDTAAINAAITAAGPYGVVYFPKTNGSYLVSQSIKPLERQRWTGQHNPRYAWDSLVNGGSIIRAMPSFSGPAVIYNNPSTTNGQSTGVSRGVVLDHLGVFGNGEDGAVDGIDQGPASGSERAWTVEACQFMYCGTAFAGYWWASKILFNHVSRNGYGVAAHRGVDSTARLNDTKIIGNFFYFNYHHCIELGGSHESGLCMIHHNRFERSGVSMDPMNPDVNRDQNACGVLITRATVVSIVGNTTDANARQGLRIEAAAHGVVNNVTGSSNIWKRDGTGDNSASMVAGVYIKDSAHCSFHGDTITYGKPNDGGPGRNAPQYGIEYEANDYLVWTGSIQLDTNSNIVNNGIRRVGTANHRCRVEHTRGGYTVLPAHTTTTRPVDPPEGALAYNIAGAVRAPEYFNGTAWIGLGGGGASGGGTWKGSQAEYDALTKDDATLYAVLGSGGLRRLYVGSDLFSEHTVTVLGKQNSFIGITSGTTVTTGNSGSTSGDAFDAVSGSVVANTSADLTTAYDRGVICSLSSSQAAYAAYDHADYSSGAYVRSYVRRASAPGVTTRVVRGYNGTTMLWEVRWQADGQVILVEAGGTWIKSVAGVTGTNTVYRIEAYVAASGSDLRVYAGESTTPLTTTDQPGEVGAATWDETRFGIFTTTNQTLSHELAAVAVGPSGWWGPA